MTPDANYFTSLPTYGHTKADHAAHTSPKGIPYPDDLIPGMKSTKLGKIAMKFVHKPHLKLNSKPTRAKAPKRRKKT
jgi:hypothetical protein